MFCNRRLVRGVAVGLVLAWMPGSALAFLESGTLLTNAASASYVAGGTNNTITYSATAKILVANPAMFLWKDATPSYVMSTAGGTIDFQICFSNGGSNTAFRMTITDILPNNTYWVGNYSEWVAGSSVYESYNVGGGFIAGTPAAMTPVPITLRWVIPVMNIGNSGCVYFRVSIG